MSKFDKFKIVFKGIVLPFHTQKVERKKDVFYLLFLDIFGPNWAKHVNRCRHLWFKIQTKLILFIFLRETKARLFYFFKKSRNYFIKQPNLFCFDDCLTYLFHNKLKS